MAAQVLAGLPPARLLTSSSGRARGTAAYLSRETGLEAEPADDLREFYLGGWQGLSREEAASQFPDEYAAWVRGEDVRRGGGETYAEVAARVGGCLVAALADLPPGAALVAVTHGGSARAGIGSLLGLPVSAWWRLASLGNARWTVLAETERGLRLAEHNAGVTEPVDRSRATAASDVEPDEGLAASADI